MSSTICFNLDGSKILSSGNGLIATIQLSSEASLNSGRCQNGVSGKGILQQDVFVKHKWPFFKKFDLYI